MNSSAQALRYLRCALPSSIRVMVAAFPLKAMSGESVFWQEEYCMWRIADSGETSWGAPRIHCELQMLGIDGEHPGPGLIS